MTGRRVRSAGIARWSAVLVAASLVAAACSSGDDETGAGDSAGTDPGAVAAPAADQDATQSTTGTDTGTDAAADGGTGDLAGTDAGAATGGDAVPTGPFDIDAVLQADPDCPNPVTGEPLVVGYAADMGELGAFGDGPASQTAIHIANLVNCSGGLDGRPVEVSMADISGDPVASREQTMGLVEGGVSVLLGPPFPDPGFRVLQVTEGGVPVIFTGSTEPALGDDSNLSFLVAFSDTQGATAAAQFAQSQGWTTAVTFSSPGPYFGYNPLVFTEVFTAQGGQIVADFPYLPIETLDFTEAIAAIADDPPDVIYSAMIAVQLVALKQQLAEAGLADVEVIGTDAFEATNGYSLAPGNEGIYHVTHTDPRPDTRLQQLLTSYAAANGGVPPASPSMAALAGDAMAVIADAYLRVDSTDPAALGQAIATATGVQGITGVLTYDMSGAPSKPMFVHRVVDGQATLAGIVGG
ncbi:MAG: ABC transporter substrate-binding protein [Actinomycetota bacterium]